MTRRIASDAPKQEDNNSASSSSSEEFNTTREEEDEDMVPWTKASSDDGDGDDEPGSFALSDAPKPATRPSVRTCNQDSLQLQRVEEGSALQAEDDVPTTTTSNEPGIVCHHTCPFPTTGKHCLGCTLAPTPEFDPRYDYGAMPDCTVADGTDTTYDIPPLDNVLIEGMEEVDGTSRSEYQRCARNLLMLFLSIGSIILVMVVVVPSQVTTKDGSGGFAEIGLADPSEDIDPTPVLESPVADTDPTLAPSGP